MITEQTMDKKMATSPVNQLQTLLRTKRGPCLSVIITLHTKSSERRQNIKIVEHAIERALHALEGIQATPLQIKKMSERLQSLASAIDPNHVKSGVGLFVSPQVMERVDFSFDVTDCVVVGETFETRDILYRIQQEKAYYVLSMSKQAIHLFAAKADVVQEIRDGYFPRKYHDAYEYARPSRGNSFGNSLKSFEKDKDILSDLRMGAYLKRADDKLSAYLGSSQGEVVLVGPPKLIHQMSGNHVIAHHVTGKVPGTFDPEDHLRIGSLAWKECRKYREAQIDALIKKADDTAFNLKKHGIRDVWEAAAKGKGALLLVEKDLRYPAYVPEGYEQIRLRRPKGNFRFVEDAVDDVIETVVLKGGKVVFVPENALARFERIVLLLRYQ